MSELHDKCHKPGCEKMRFNPTHWPEAAKPDYHPFEWGGLPAFVPEGLEGLLAPSVDFPGDLRLRVLAGSHAHGTATPESDYDWRGVYQLPTDDFLGVRNPETTIERPPDQVYWELRHFCQLLLKGNPNIVAMLWTPDDCVWDTSLVVQELTKVRQALISTSMAAAYIGWVHREMGQVAKLKHVPAKRMAHVPRLLWELRTAVLTGEIPVRLPAEHLEVVRLIKSGADPDGDEWVGFCGSLLLDVEALVQSTYLPPPPTELVGQILLNARHGEYD